MLKAIVVVIVSIVGSLLVGGAVTFAVLVIADVLDLRADCKRALRHRANCPCGCQEGA